MPPVSTNFKIRAATGEDLAAIDAVQQISPESAHWPAAEYLGYQCLVAEIAGAIAGFVVWRSAGECEILNLAIHPEYRRRSIGTALMRAAIERCSGDIFLEVRESNQAALAFYQALGFEEVGRRPGYYPMGDETAVVMKFHSC